MGLRPLGAGSLRRIFTNNSAARLIRNPAIAEARPGRSVRFSLNKAATAPTSILASAGFVTTLYPGHAASNSSAGVKHERHAAFCEPREYRLDSFGPKSNVEDGG